MNTYWIALILSLLTVYPSHALTTGYASLAKMTLAAPVVAKILVHKQKQPPKEQRTTTPGQVRLIIEADVLAVLKAPDLVPGRITYVWEGPLDAGGKAPNFKKQTLMVYLSPDSAADSSYRLINAGGQQSWSDPDEQTVRQIAKEASADPAAAVEQITSVRSGFVSSPDDSPPEVQFIIDTRSQTAMALTLRGNSVLATRNDGVDDGLPIMGRSLLWYQLACGLPPALPEAVLADQPSSEDAAHIKDAYAKILQQLGVCE